ncbi:MAG TPA: SpoIIE family protein phosphatase [Actinocrinis sp.]|nr:SpoIIE family protein phosphatase [Actinocrinis sp.]
MTPPTDSAARGPALPESGAGAAGSRAADRGAAWFRPSGPGPVAAAAPVLGMARSGENLPGEPWSGAPIVPAHPADVADVAQATASAPPAARPAAPADASGPAADGAAFGLGTRHPRPIEPIGAAGGLLDLIRIATFVLDLSGRIVVWSPSAERMTGRPAARMLGAPVAEIFPADLAGHARELFHRVSGRTGWIGVLPVRHRDGRVFDVGFRASTQHFPGGVDLVQVVATDAQDLRRVERNRLAILNSANSRIGTSLEMERTAAELAEVAVPRFADRIQVRLLESVQDPAFPVDRQSPDQPIRLRRTVVHAAGRDEAVIAGPARSVAVQPGTPLHALLLGPRARLLPPAPDGRTVISPQLSAWSAADAAAPGAPDTPAASSAPADQAAPATAPAHGHAHSTAHAVHNARRIVAPLFARGTLLGLATFTRAPGRPVFGGADLEVAEELATRTALCIENGRLYHRERSTALMLQRSLLPERIPHIDAVEVAFRYRPGPIGAEVGGDWFDVIALPGNRVGFVVGDVMGSGLRAAGTMGQFRTAVRTLAQLDLSPAAVLRELDQLAQSMSESHIATCVYAVYDPVDGHCLAAAAGHLPPLLIRPQGAVSLLDLPVGAPLGVGTNRFDEHEFTVEPGSTLALYTDGLVEDRYQDIDAGLADLVALVGKAEYGRGRPGSLEALGDLVFHQMSDPHRLDDATLLLATLGRLPGERMATWTLNSAPTIAAQGRALVRDQLADWHLDGLADTAELLVSELVTNALRYGRGDIGLRLLRNATSLVCEISDGLESAPRLRTVHYSDEGGRGLYLVDQMSQRWGTRTTNHGKIVWFELPLS